jgi:hypothetical protein
LLEKNYMKESEHKTSTKLFGFVVREELQMWKNVWALLLFVPDWRLTHSRGTISILELLLE